MSDIERVLRLGAGSLADLPDFIDEVKRLREELHYAAVALDIERAETDRLRLAELEARAEVASLTAERDRLRNTAADLYRADIQCVEAERDAALASLAAEREQNKRLREAAQEWAVLVVENHGVETILTGYEHRLLAAVVALDAGAATGGERSVIVHDHHLGKVIIEEEDI